MGNQKIDISDFLNKRKVLYEKRIERLEKQERDSEAILEVEPDRQDMAESINDCVKLLDRYSALVEFIEELQETYGFGGGNL
ncbi:MAG TPA: hypothetical protein GXX75_06910 [Clostridiales bacterium]|nr:hypothetical protein [Clostridiales bacterium]